MTSQQQTQVEQPTADSGPADTWHAAAPTPQEFAEQHGDPAKWTSTEHEIAQNLRLTA